MSKLSVVVATCNRSEDLKKLLISLTKQGYFPFDIIIVDDSTSLVTQQLVKPFINEFGSANCRLKYVRGNHNGLAAARNLGLVSTEGDYVLFLDDDTELDYSCFEKLISILNGNMLIGAAQPKLICMNKRDSIDSAGVMLNVVGFGRTNGFNEKDVGQYDHISQISYAKGAAIIIRKDVCMHLGGYDPIFSFHFEESDLCWRLWLNGFQVIFVPSAKVFHAGGATASKNRGNIYNNNSQFLFYRNRIIMVIKNLELINLIKFFPWLSAMSSYYIILSIRRNNVSDVLGHLRAIFWCISFFKIIWRRRLQIQSSRQISDAALFKMGIIQTKIFL